MFLIDIDRVTVLNQNSTFLAIRGRNTRTLASINIVPKNIIAMVIKCIERREKSKNLEGPINNCNKKAVMVSIIPAPMVYFQVDLEKR